MCKKVKQKLVAYLDGELNKQQRLLIEKHLSQCAECRKEAGLLKKTGRLLKNQECVIPSADFEARLRERIQGTEEKQRLPQVIFERLTHLLLPAVVAAALIVGVVVGNLVEKIVPSQTVPLQEEAYTLSIGLDNFQDFPPGSLPEVYFSLTDTQEVEK